MADSILTTSKFNLPNHLAEGVWQKVQDSSALARLCGSTPLLFGQTQFMTFTGQPKAEFVGENSEKSPSYAEFGTKTAVPHKAQVTVRFTDEVQYADTDYQLSCLQALTDSISVSLARALDLGGIHALNPLSGEKATTITDAVTLSAGTTTATGDPEKDVETSAGVVIGNGYVPTGLAIDPLYAWDFKTAKFGDGRKKYPELSMNIKNAQSIEGLVTAVSDTVSATKEAKTATNIKAIVGQWDAFKWGVQRDIPVQTLTSGDPDGLGDLARNNQIALRAEVVYGWVVLDSDAFNVIKGASA